MLGTRHEEYGHFTDGLPFVLNTDLKRTCFCNSKENNWHDDPEIQMCTGGNGKVLLDGREFSFCPNDIVAVNSNVLHYTGTDTELTYSCIIVSADFCKRVGIDPTRVAFSPLVKSVSLAALFQRLIDTYSNPREPYRIAKLNQMLLGLLLELAEHHSVPQNAIFTSQDLEKTKETILYIRNNYRQKITLDDLSRAVLYDKYALCRKFKQMTGQTILQYINNYRCIKAIDYLNEGYTVAQAATLCGFDNLSFFTKTFKKYTGRLPSSYK